MPKPHTYPTLYDEALQISISKLKEWEYLKPHQTKSGTLNWSKNGNETGSISIYGNTNSPKPYIELDYKYRGEPRNYKVYLTSTPSNLNRGEIWYFLCPQTNKRCRKLYSIDGYFLHREAFNNCMYSSQIDSKRYRLLKNTIEQSFLIDTFYSEIYKKHFKQSYAGKPTKKYLRIMQQIQKADNVPFENFLTILKSLK